MIECHPLLRPIVQLAKPVVHAVKTLHPRVVGVRHHIHHHVHRIVTAATPPQAVMTVCQRVAGPIVAGGLVLLPPASAVPPAGGVGGFPGAIVPEYGAPAFGPGFAGPAPFAYGPGGGYGPAALGLGGVLAPSVIASNTPQNGTQAPGTSVPDVPVLMTSGPPAVSVPPSTPPGASPPGTSTPPSDSPPGTSQPTPPDNPQPPSNPPTNPNPPGGGPGTPVDTPEPASIALLASALATVILSRAFWLRRTRRD